MDIGNINWRQVEKIRSSFHFLIGIYDLLDCSFCRTKKKEIVLSMILVVLHNF